MQRLRPQTSILTAGKGEGAVPTTPERGSEGLPHLTLATWIQSSTNLALSWAVMVGSPRQVVMTHLTTLIKWVMVAWMVGARCSLPLLSHWDQMESRKWRGINFMNSSWGGQGVLPNPATSQLSVHSPQSQAGSVVRAGAQEAENVA